MRVSSFFTVAQAAIGDGLRQYRALKPFEACVENVGQVKVYTLKINVFFSTEPDF